MVVPPPPDVRSVVDAVVPLVRAGNTEAVAKLVEAEPLKYAFMNVGDAHHAWYSERLGAAAGERTGEVHRLEAIAGNGKVAPCSPLLFAHKQPPVSQRDLAVIKQTAAVAVRTDTDAFVAALLEEKKDEKQFVFLRQGHTLRPLFDTYVAQYRAVLDLPDAYRDKLTDVLRDRFSLLQRAAARAEHNQEARAQARRAAEVTLARELEDAQIDWNDFVVVETITFSEADRTAPLAAPLDRKEVETASLASGGHVDPAPEKMFKSPYTGEMVPASEFAEHMRIMNLDPTWREQKRLQDEKQRTTNIDVASAPVNIKRFARAMEVPPAKRAK